MITCIYVKREAYINHIMVSLEDDGSSPAEEETVKGSMVLALDLLCWICCGSAHSEPEHRAHMEVCCYAKEKALAEACASSQAGVVQHDV